MNVACNGKKTTNRPRGIGVWESGISLQEEVAMTMPDAVRWRGICYGNVTV